MVQVHWYLFNEVTQFIYLYVNRKAVRCLIQSATSHVIFNKLYDSEYTTLTIDSRSISKRIIDKRVDYVQIVRKKTNTGLLEQKVKAGAQTLHIYTYFTEVTIPLNFLMPGQGALMQNLLLNVHLQATLGHR